MSRRHLSVFLGRFVKIRARDLCEYCRLPQSSQDATYHIDHVVPLKSKGPTSADNLALACVLCSLKKGARLRARDPLTTRWVSVFNPRKQNWHDHFQWVMGWQVKGKTSIGRATIAALDLNRPRLVQIRIELAKIGAFPPEE